MDIVKGGVGESTYRPNLLYIIDLRTFHLTYSVAIFMDN